MIDVDVHAHLAPVDDVRLAGLSGIQWDAADQRMVVDGHVVGMKDLFYPDRLVRWMDQNQIARSLVSIPPPLYRQGLDANQARVWVDYLNDALLSVIRPFADRLQALFYFPLEHPSLLEGLMSRYAQGDFAGVALAAGGHPDIVYSRPEYAGLWSFLDEHKAFVFIHPGTCSDPRLTPFYLENLVGNPYETGVAATHLVMADIPRRHENIRFCLAHAGGVFPCLCGRLERGFFTRRPGVDVDATETPLQAARRFYVDGIAHNDAALVLAQEIFGADHVLYGSDWPFPMGLKDPAHSKA